MTRAILKDSGWSKPILELLKKHSITVGIHEKDGVRDAGELTNAEVGHFHEYGLGVPERSFLRSTFDENDERLVRLMNRGFARVAKGVMSVDLFLDYMGKYMKDRVIDKINSNVPPSLSESTIAAKGSSTALIDTGDLKRSIDYEVK